MPSDLIQQQQEQEYEEGEGEEGAQRGVMGQQGEGYHRLQGQGERSPDGEGPTGRVRAAGSCEGSVGAPGKEIGEGGGASNVGEAAGGGAGQREAEPLDPGEGSGDVSGEGEGASVGMTRSGDKDAGEGSQMEEDDTPGGQQSAATIVDCNQ